MHKYEYYLTANFQSKKVYLYVGRLTGSRVVGLDWQWQITFRARDHFTAHCAQF